MNIYFTVRDACMKMHWFILAKRMTDGGFKELADGERTDGIARRSTVSEYNWIELNWRVQRCQVAVQMDDFEYMPLWIIYNIHTTLESISTSD